MHQNPEIDYINHVQNTSLSKQASKFGKAKRFREPRKTQTDFNYQIRLPNNRKSCSFGFGNRSALQYNKQIPSPDKYNVRKFPHNNRSTTMGFNRNEVIFGSMIKQAQRKATLPSPDAYNLPSTMKDVNITFKIKLPDEIQIKLKKKGPGPGQYKPIQINRNGTYPISQYKNARSIFLNGQKNFPFKQKYNVGPGAYTINGMGDQEKILNMRKTTTKIFGSAKRKGPEQRHRIHIPGPGMYDTFSAFGENYIDSRFRSNTEY